MPLAVGPHAFFHVTNGKKFTNTGMNKFSQFFLIAFAALTLVFAFLSL